MAKKKARIIRVLSDKRLKYVIQQRRLLRWVDVVSDDTFLGAINKIKKVANG